MTLVAGYLAPVRLAFNNCGPRAVYLNSPDLHKQKDKTTATYKNNHVYSVLVASLNILVILPPRIINCSAFAFGHWVD